MLNLAEDFALTVYKAIFIKLLKKIEFGKINKRIEIIN